MPQIIRVAIYKISTPIILESRMKYIATILVTY